MKRKYVLGVFVFAAFFAGLIYHNSSASAQQSEPADLDSVIVARPENSTPQTLPFSQNWTTDLLTVNDDWSAVPGIVGFRGDDLTPGTGTDARTLLAEAGLPAGPVIDVNINQTAPDTFATGGVAEFEIANRVVALNGSGTADAPYLVLYLNTTGQNNIRVSYNVRDLDASADNAIQQVNTQYRVGNTGNFINVPGGYVADATTVSTATQVTPVAVTLPAAANNKPEIQVRILTTNAIGNDEWVGIDDISVTTVGTPLRQGPPVDMNGDGRTDFVVVRSAGGVDTQSTWFTSLSGGNPIAPRDWGVNGDILVPGDYDGDLSDDVAVFRASNGTFYIIQSATLTMRIEQFGQAGDNPRVLGDYDGDGRDDLALYRAGAQSVWFYKTSPTAQFTAVNWGQTGDSPAPGDYDGDGVNDFVVQRPEGSAARFYARFANGSIDTKVFGLATDDVVPGDYDGDAHTDLAVVRTNAGGFIVWEFLSTATNTIVTDTWGVQASGDLTVQGDYDGDGKTDYAIWRPGTQATFFMMTVGTRLITTKEWGQTGDLPAARYNTF